MGVKLTRNAPGWEGSFLAGNTLTLRVPLGLTVHQIFSEYSFTAAAAPVALADAVGDIRVLMNGQPVWIISAADLDVKNKYEGRNAAAGILVLDFDRYNLRTRAAEEFTSVGSGDPTDPTPLSTFTVELQLKTGSGVDGGSITSKLRQSEARPLGFIKKVRRFVNQFSASGEVDLDKFPKGELINAVHFFESANDIDSVQLLRDNYEMFNRTKELNARIQSDGVRTPQAGVYVFDTCEDGNGTDQVVTAGVDDFRFKLNIDGAMTITSYVEYLGPLSK